MSQSTPTRMSLWFIAAAFVSASTAAIHVVAGTPEIMEPIWAAELPPVVKGVSDVLWHHVTGMLLIAAAAGLWAAWRPAWRVPVLALIGGQYLVIVFLFLGFGFHWFGSPWPMPQWALFTAAITLMLIGVRRP